MTEKEKMINGLKYNPANWKLVLDRAKANRICTKYNRRAFNEINMRSRKMKKLLNTTGNFWIKPPFYVDYGYNVFLGKNVMLNYGCVILDVCPVRIGDHTLIGPGTHIYTACHSLNVWIGGNCCILPGITIGDNTIIGAGSVVTKDIPENVVAVGNPCKVIRKNSD